MSLRPRLLDGAACDIRVRRGNLHKITGRIGKQWFIDSVEPLVSTNTISSA